MSNMSSVAAVLPGILAGSIIVQFVIHWAHLLLAGLRRDSDSSPSPEQSKLNWALLFAVIHPVPWLLLVGVPYGIFRLVQNPPADGWLWFFGGIVFWVIACLLLAYLVTRKVRARSATKTDATT